MGRAKAGTKGANKGKRKKELFGGFEQLEKLGAYILRAYDSGMMAYSGLETKQQGH